MVTTPTTAPLDAAQRLAPEIRDRALDGERLRTMPPELVRSIRDAGLFRLALPTALGGFEADPATLFDAIEVVSHADGSAGWTTMIGNSGFLFAWLDPDVAAEVVGDDPDQIVSAPFPPAGRAVSDPADGTLVVDGRWSFCSGCVHADWMVDGVVVMDGDAPRVVGDRPDWRFAFYPAAEAEIVDNWQVSGLRGTGSHDVVARGVRVRPERTISPFFEPARFDGPLYRMPLVSILCAFLSAFSHGVARRAVDEFVALAATKSRSVPPGRTLAQDEAIQVELARVEAARRSSRAFVLEAIGSAWDTVCGGDDLSMQQRGDLLLATLHSTRTAREVADAMFAQAGAGALHETSPIQRCARDAAAGSQHGLFNPDQWKATGRILLGLDPASFRI